MAKRISQTEVRVVVDPVNGVHTLVCMSYKLDDDTLAGVTYNSAVGPNPCASRAVTAQELSGTLQEFLDSMKTTAETQEGIGV